MGTTTPIGLASVPSNQRTGLIPVGFCKIVGSLAPPPSKTGIFGGKVSITESILPKRISDAFFCASNACAEEAAAGDACAADACAADAMAEDAMAVDACAADTLAEDASK